MYWTDFLPPYRYDKTNIDLKKTGCESEDWIHLAQDRDLWWALVNIAMNPHSIKCEEILD
jgi:hypothetical protein